MPTIGGVVIATGTEKSGRRTLLDVVDELARPIDASDTTIRALAADAFRSAVRIMNRKGLWPWEILDEDVSITADIKFSTISSPVKKPLAMHLLTAAAGERNRSVNFISYDRFMEQYSLDITGTPYAYTIPNLFETAQVRWYPTPSGAENARFTFYRVTPAPRTEAEAVEIPDHALEVYMAYAWSELMKRLPTGVRPEGIADAYQTARLAFRELSAHVASPGDRSREVNIYG
jgi:hypothetical protein